MFMVSVAVGGYMFFGPASKTASGAHDRPANVATSIPVTEQVTTATLPITSVDPTYTDLDSMRAEMAAIHNRVTAMLEQAQPLRSATDPMIDNPAGSVGLSTTITLTHQRQLHLPTVPLPMVGWKE
jgi:hypothetical protein